MAQGPIDADRKRELSARLAASRTRVRLGRTRLKQDLNPLHRLRNAVRKKPLKTFAVAAGTAFTVSLLRRPAARKHRGGLSRAVLRNGFRLAKPALRFWLLKIAKDHFAGPRPPKAPPIHHDNS